MDGNKSERKKEKKEKICNTSGQTKGGSTKKNRKITRKEVAIQGNVEVNQDKVNGKEKRRKLKKRGRKIYA